MWSLTKNNLELWNRHYSTILVPQVDKGNIDYFSGHIQTVVNTVTTNNEKIVAYLHDSIEYTNLDLNSLNNIFDNEIIDAISTITKDKKLIISNILNQ